MTSVLFSLILRNIEKTELRCVLMQYQVKKTCAAISEKLFVIQINEEGKFLKLIIVKNIQDRYQYSQEWTSQRVHRYVHGLCNFFTHLVWLNSSAVNKVMTTTPHSHIHVEAPSVLLPIHFECGNRTELWVLCIDMIALLLAKVGEASASEIAVKQSELANEAIVTGKSDCLFML